MITHEFSIMTNKSKSADDQRMVSRRHAWGGAGISIALFVLLHTTPARAQSFDDALAMAYAGNPALQAERAKLRSVDESVGVALSDWRPTAAVQANTGASHQTFNNTSGDLRPADASLTITQPIYNGGSTVA